MIKCTIPSDDVRVGMLDKTIWTRIPPHLVQSSLHLSLSLFVSSLRSENIVFYSIRFDLCCD